VHVSPLDNVLKCRKWLMSEKPRKGVTDIEAGMAFKRYANMDGCSVVDVVPLIMHSIRSIIHVLTVRPMQPSR
jgi:hypothetical protein